MTQYIRRRGRRLHRRILWLSPLVIAVPLFLGLHSLFGMELAAATPLLSEVPHFRFEQQAQQHCPDDAVVWTISRLGTYHSNLERWYGQTSDGTFACLQEAERAGYQAAHRR